MDGLRWWLLFFGVLVIVGVYFYTRRQQEAPEPDELPRRREPTLTVDDGGPGDAGGDDVYRGNAGTGDADGGGAAPIARAGALGAPGELVEPEPPILSPELDDEPVDEPSQPSPGEQKIVTLRLVARNRGAFAGDELILSMRGIGMRHGKFGIFHRVDGDDDDRQIFSAASLVEPGSFDLANIKEQEIPGISLFMVLPGPIDGVEAFDMMMAAARALAQSLDGELLDESGSTLSIQRERYMREEVVQHAHSNLVA